LAESDLILKPLEKDKIGGSKVGESVRKIRFSRLHGAIFQKAAAFTCNIL
jgi:hypothetical protein